MSDVEVDPLSLVGRQRPTHELLCPATDYDEVPRAIQLAEDAGLILDDWQKYLLRQLLGVQEDGLWAVFQALIVVSRRNGKSYLMAARVLAGLFLLDERDIVWSSHRYDTAMDTFKLVKKLIWETPELRAELARTRNNGISTTHGDESITLRNGARVRFKTRTKDGGRGLDGDLVIIDEAQAAQNWHMGAMLPTVGARPNPQIIYTGSAGDASSEVAGDLYNRAFESEPDDPTRSRLYAALWSMDEGDDRSDPRTWAKTNPSYNKRLDPQTVAGFYQAWKYNPDYFDREHLGLGDYPRPEGETWIVPSANWKRREVGDSTVLGEVVLAVDGARDLSWAAISLAGFNAAGQVHMEVVEHVRGTRWVIERISNLLAGEYPTSHPVVMDSRCPLAYLVPDLEVVGVPLRLLTPEETADAAAWFVDSGAEDPPPDEGPWSPTWVHPPQIPSTVALAAAKTRPRGDRIVLSRQAGGTDVSPLLSMVYAGFGLQLLGRAPDPPPSPELVSDRFRSVTPTGIAGANF